LRENLSKLGEIIAAILGAARIPGAAIAIVSDEETVFAQGYGYRALETRLPMAADTVYPIASTTKAINATLVGMLVDEGKLAWDTPVQNYLPRFFLGDFSASSQVTIRDLLVMRTGLPRHDWLWIGNSVSRAELVDRLRYLELSAGFREKFQYNNLTATTAGHIAEVVTGRPWEELVQQKILGPLGMTATSFALPMTPNITLSYHESRGRDLLLTKRLAGEVTAPSGGAMHSTVGDMARWIAFNLTGAKAQGCPLIQPQTLSEIQSPQMPARTDSSCPTPNAAYAMGWFVDTYNGRSRVSHGGYIHDVNSSVMLFPQDDIGVVSFINFGSPRLSGLINEHVFDLLVGSKPAQTVEEKLALYEHKIEDNRKRITLMHRIQNTSPSHCLDDYAGMYAHAGYGQVEVCCNSQVLIFRRGDLSLPLEHWHYEVWVFAESDLFEIHEAHSFDHASRVLFETSADGEICALSIQLEPAVAAIRFTKQ